MLERVPPWGAWVALLGGVLMTAAGARARAAVLAVYAMARKNGACRQLWVFAACAVAVLVVGAYRSLGPGTLLSGRTEDGGYCVRAVFARNVDEAVVA